LSSKWRVEDVDKHDQLDRPDEGNADTYEPPAIEKAMTPEDLEREVHYAGDRSIILCL
jgi:hypothetical protein